MVSIETFTGNTIFLRDDLRLSSILEHYPRRSVTEKVTGVITLTHFN